MVDLERMGGAIGDIEKYVAEIASYDIQKTEDVKEGKTKHATAMLLFTILNRMSDIGNELLSEEKMSAPTRYLDIMPMLAKANVINEDLANTLNELMEKRNALAHFYGDISSKEILILVKKLSAVEQFLKTIKKHIQRREAQKES